MLTMRLLLLLLLLLRLLLAFHCWWCRWLSCRVASHQDFASRDTSSLVNVGGGGAPTPISQVRSAHGYSAAHLRASQPDC
jgi:hypothetical protein